MVRKISAAALVLSSVPVTLALVLLGAGEAPAQTSAPVVSSSHYSSSGDDTPWSDAPTHVPGADTPWQGAGNDTPWK